MNPAHWPWAWTLLVGGVAGFVVGVTTSAGIAARAAVGLLRRDPRFRQACAEIAREQIVRERQAAEKGGTIPPA